MMDVMTPSGREMDILKVLWELGPASVRDVCRRMCPNGELAFNTIQTLLRIMDEKGHTRIVDRKKDMILVSGFNVYPNEIEGVVMMHPGVLECAAVGVADQHSSEAVKLFVVRKDPDLTEKEVRAHCHQNLTGYKCPKYVEFRTELPKTNVGKILRRALRDEKTAKH